MQNKKKAAFLKKWNRAAVLSRLTLLATLDAEKRMPNASV